MVRFRYLDADCDPEARNFPLTYLGLNAFWAPAYAAKTSNYKLRKINDTKVTCFIRQRIGT